MKRNLAPSVRPYRSYNNSSLTHQKSIMNHLKSIGSMVNGNSRTFNKETTNWKPSTLISHNLNDNDC